jgi:CheY-like chemotaxis protein
MDGLGPIIIVEDDEEDKELLVDVLKELQISNELKVFLEGSQVLDYLRTTTDRPLIILTDINMPGMNGLELREEICKDEFLRKKSIPFVFLTTTNGKHIIDQVYAMQVQGFFQKKDSYTQIKNQIKLIIDYWLECKHPNNY